MNMNLTKRIFSFLLALMMVVGMLPPAAIHAEEIAPTEETVVVGETAPETAAPTAAPTIAATVAPTAEPTEATAVTVDPTEATEAPAQPTVPEETAAPTVAPTEAPVEDEATKPSLPAITEENFDFMVSDIAAMAASGSYIEELQPSSDYPESDHNYANNANKTYTYTVPGAAYLKLTFSAETFTESGYDYIYIYNGSGSQLGKYSGDGLAGKTIQVTGNTVKIKLTSDGSAVKYGFSLSSIYAGFLITLTGMEIATLPDRVGYKIGDTIDLTGLTVTLTDSTGNEYTRGVADGVSLISGNTSTKGRKTVTVGYEDLRAQFEIGVHNVISGETLMDKSGYPESSHNYGNNLDKTWTYYVAGAESLRLKFNSSTETESGCDYIYLYDSNDVELGKYSGTELSSKTIAVAGDTVKIRLDTDGSEKEYGFALDSIYATNIAQHEMDSGVYTPHTCTRNAYTTYSCTICDYAKVETHANTAAHTWNEGVYTDPTCTKDGYTTFTCIPCGTTKTETNTGSALGHSPDEGVYTAPDCYADAFTTYTCTVCGNVSKETETGTAFHTFDNGVCTTCGVSDEVTAGGWLDGKNTYWAMLPGNVLYLGGNGTATSNANYRSKMSAATSLIIGEGITTLGIGCLQSLTKLTTIRIPDTVTRIDYNAFYGCTNLRSVYIPDSVKTITANTYDYPFNNCSNVKIFCEATSAPSSWSSRWNYYASGSVASTSYGVSDEDFQFWSTLNTSASTIVIPDDVTMIPERAFYNCDNLTSITIGSGVTAIGGYAFYDCDGLRNIYIPAGVKSVGSSTFFGCSSNLKIFCGNSNSSGCASGWNSYSSGYYLPTCYGISPEEFSFWTTLSASATSVEIPDYVTTIPAYAFSNLSYLKSVTIPDSVTKIQANAFYNRDGLTTLKLGSGVTSIGENAFYDCDGLTAIYIPASVTSISASGTSKSPFYGCNSTLKIYCGGSSKGSSWGSYWNYYASGSTVGTGSSLTVVYNVPASEFAFWSVLDTTKETIEIPDGLTSIPAYAFRNMTGIKKAIIPESVTTIASYAFSGCTGLTEIEIPGSLTSIGMDAFYGCTSLTEIVLPEGLETIGDYAFAGCSSLTTIYLPASLKKIEDYAFNNCTALEAVHVADLSAWCGINFAFNNPNPLYYGSLYLDGELVTDLVIPEDVTQISDRAFYGASITSVTIHEGVTKIGTNAFYNCSDLTAVYVSDLSAWCGISFGGYTANPLYYGTLYLDGQAVTDVVIPEDVTSISSDAFSYRGLTSVTIHPGVTAIGASAFYSCSNLKEVHIQDLSAWCAIDFPDYFANPVYYSKALYVNGQKLTSLTIPEGNTYVGSYAFANCLDLQSVVIPSHVKEIHEGAFYYCKGLTSVQVADGLTTVGAKAFYNCSTLAELDLPDTVSEIGDYAFYYCSALTSFDVPENVIHIGSSTFYSCKNLTEVTLPARLGSIGGSAFYGCTGLTEIRIPAAVSSIGSGAFNGCSGITEVYFSGSAPSIYSNAFTSVTAQAYYPYNGAGWNDTMLVNYGGKLTWQSYSPEGITDQGTCGTGVTWVLDEDGALLISGSGTMNDYSVSGGRTTAPWASYAGTITQLVVDAGVTYVGKNAFYGCSQLKEINFLGGMPEFAPAAFYGVKATAAYKANNDTWIPGELGNFGGTITWKPIGMYEDYMAQSNPNSTYSYWRLDYEGTLTLYQWEANYSYASAPWYSYRHHIKKVIFDARYSIAIGNYSFYNLTELTDFVVKNNTVSSVGKSAFQSCEKLKNVELGDNVESIGDYAFYYCSALESIFLPPDHYNWSIGERAFSYCTALKEVSIPCTVTLGTEVFFGSTNLKSIYINENANGYNFAPATDSFETVTATVYYPRDSWGYGTPSGSYGGDLTWVEADIGTCGPNARWSYDPDTGELTIYGSGRICNSYFAGGDHPWGAFNDEILSIQVLEGITEITSFTFEYCTAATTVILPEGITIDLNAFNDCESMNNLILPHSLQFGSASWNTSFIRCNSLTDVYYFGTEEEWDQIEDSENVTSLDSTMTLHFLELVSSTSTCTEAGVQAHYRYDDTSVYDEMYDLNRNPITALATTPALGHNEVIDAAVSATCSKTGLTEGKHCDRCGETLVAQTVTAVLGHDMSDWVVTEEATCTEDGKQRRDCSRCDHFEEEVIEVPGHDMGDWDVVTPATCTVDGLQRKDCSRCDHFEEEVIPATGEHNYVNNVCSMCQKKVYTYTWELVGMTINGEHSGSVTVDTASYTATLVPDVAYYLPATVKAGEYSSSNVYLGPDYDKQTGVVTWSSSYAALTGEAVAAGAMIGDTYYETAREAVRAASATNATVKLLKDNISYPMHEIEITGDVTIDLNGFRFWSGSYENGPGGISGLIVREGASLTLTGTGLLFGENVDGYAVENYGTLKIESGVSKAIWNPGTTDDLLGQGNAVKNYGVAEIHGVTGLIWNAGTITLDVDYTNDTLYNQEGGAMYITGGTYSGSQYGALYNRFGDVYISGGTFTKSINGSRGNIYINGGVFEKEIYVGIDDTTTPGTVYSLNVEISNARFPNGLKVTHSTSLSTTIADILAENVYVQANGKMVKNLAVKEIKGDVVIGPECLHAWDEATCTTVKTCPVCGLTEGEPLGHDMSDWVVTEETSCTVDGLQRKDCSRCDHFEEEVIVASGHSYQAVVTDPTCTEDGYTTHTCSACGDTYTDSIVGKLGHTEVIDEAVAATCTETGLTEGKHCSVCNEVLVAQTVTNALGHTEVVDEAVAATCTETGLTEGKHCSVCNEVLVAQTVTNALGHTEVIDEAVAATCTETGLTEGKHCSVCNEVLVVQTVTNALDHDMGEWEVITPVTCTEDGLQRKDCSRCDHFEEEVVEALGHKYKAVVTQPTCLTDGYTTHTCVCGDSYTDTVMNALGHNHLPRVVPPTYTKRGYIEHKCSRCDDFWNDTYTDPLGLPKPAVKAGNNPATGGGSLTWADDGEADYYEIYRATSKKGKYKLHKTVEDAEADVSVGVGKTYYYKVKAICDENPSMSSGYSAVVKVTGKCAQPDVTVAVKASTGKPVVKWGKVSSAKKYYVYRATELDGTYKKVKTTTSKSYTDTAAKVGVTYYYKVKAVASKSSYNSAYSEIQSCLTICARPSVTVKIASATGKPALGWKAISGAVAYEILRADSADGVFTSLETVTTLTYTDLSAAPDTDYWYKVNAIGESEELNSTDSTAKMIHATLAKPVVTFDLNDISGKPTLTWEAVPGAVEYKVYRSTSASKSYKAIATTTDTEYTATSAGVGKAYYYKVIAIGENCKSAYSSYKKLTAKCAQPVITVEVKESTGKPVIKWSKISGAKTYNVYRVDEATGTRTSLGSTTKTTFTDSKAEVGMTYSYQVRANGSKSAYNSDYSKICSCLTICGQPAVALKNDAATGKPTLSWKAISGAAGYEIFRAEGEGAFTLICTQAELTYTDENAVVDGVYSYKVNAIAEDAALNCVDNSSVTITAACAQPAASIVLDGKKPMVSWEPVEGATKYYVYRSTKKSSDFKKVATVEDGETYTDSKAKKGTTYYYNVVAVSENASSAYSNVLKIKSK